MLGKLGRLIKSKKNPAATLVKRYRMNLATAHFGSFFRSGDEANIQDPDEHPLLSPAALNSSLTNDYIRWPTPSRSNTFAINNSSIMGMTDDASRTFLTTYLGRHVVRAFSPEATPAFVLSHMSIRVQIGRFLFSCKRREDRKSIGTSRESWFSIRARHIPAMVETFGDTDGWNPDAMLYGRILHFVHIQVAAWRPEPFLLAEARVYRAREESHLPTATRLPLFLLDAIEFGGRVKVCRFQVQHLDKMVCVAPKPGDNACYALEL